MSNPAILAYAYNLALLVVVAFVLLRGSGPEKIGAAVNIAASGATGLLIAAGIQKWGAGYAATWLVDLSVVTMFFWLALASTRFWPIWCFGFALCDILLHPASVLMPREIAFYYESAQVIWAYLSLGVLAVATARLSPDERGKSLRGWRASRAGADQVDRERRDR
jgi:hypothetical protein